MPTYHYRCSDCQVEYEVSQRITDEPLKKCRECGGKVTRVIQPVGIIFKGSGFHVNDYPNSKGRKKCDIPAGTRDTASKPAEKPSETKEEKKTESGGKGKDDKAA